MVTLHPNFLEIDGEKAFAVLLYKEYLEIEEQLQQLEDIKALRRAKTLDADAATVSLSELRATYDLEDTELSTQ